MNRTPESDAAVAWVRRNANWLALTFIVVFFLLPRLSPFEGLNYYLNSGERLSAWTLRKVQHLFADYGYYVVFIGVLLENTMFLGLLVPGAIILILGGLAAQNGSIDLWPVIALGIAATLIGDSISYAIGRGGWARALERGSLAEPLGRVRDALQSRGRWFILVYHFAGYSRMVGPAAAGLFRIPYRRWAPFDYAGATLWVLTFTMIGVLMGALGVQFGDTERLVRITEVLFTGIIVAAIAIALYRGSRARHEPPAEALATVIAVDEEA
jgi:membrane protein DedA with SNARE-associated domain